MHSYACIFRIIKPLIILYYVVLFMKYKHLVSILDPLEIREFDDKFNMIICSWSTSYYQWRGNISSRFASELLENLEKCFFGTIQTSSYSSLMKSIQPHTDVYQSSQMSSLIFRYEELLWRHPNCHLCEIYWQLSVLKE